MKIEKLTENKIRVIINIDNLIDKDSDPYSFLKQTFETQHLILDILEKAEKEVAFKTDGCKLLIEAFSSIEDSLVFTITKFKTNTSKEDFFSSTQKVTTKNTEIENKIIYSFKDFNTFCDFCYSLNSINELNITKISKDISLFLYKTTYYLIIKNFNSNYKYIKKFHSLLSEFGIKTSYSNTFENKLLEYGDTIIKKDAINVGIKYFVS